MGGGKDESVDRVGGRKGKKVRETGQRLKFETPIDNKGRLTGRLKGRKEGRKKGGGVSKHEYLSTASASVLEASLLAPRSSATVGWSSCSVSAVSSA